MPQARPGADDVKLERTQRLIDIAENLGFAATAAHVGETVDVIVDGVEDDGDGNAEFVGHAWFQAPDCDGAVHIASGEYAVGDVATVRIVKLMSFGAFAEVVPGVDGLIHISQIADHRIEKPGDVLAEGDKVDVKITDVDMERKKISLSIRALLEAPAVETEESGEEAASSEE